MDDFESKAPKMQQEDFCRDDETGPGQIPGCELTELSGGSGTLEFAVYVAEKQETAGSSKVSV